MPQTLRDFKCHVNDLSTLAFAYAVLSCLILWDPRNHKPPGCSVHGIFQARILEWVAISYSRGSSWPRDWICISCISFIAWWILYLQCHLGSPLSHDLDQSTEKYPYSWTFPPCCGRNQLLLLPPFHQLPDLGEVWKGVELNQAKLPAGNDAHLCSCPHLHWVISCLPQALREGSSEIKSLLYTPLP